MSSGVQLGHKGKLDGMRTLKVGQIYIDDVLTVHFSANSPSAVDCLMKSRDELESCVD